MEMLRSGKIDAITSQPPFSDQLEREGYPMTLDPNTAFRAGRANSPSRPDSAVKQSFREVSSRAELKTAFGIAVAAQEKYGF